MEDLREAKKTFSRIGVGYTAFLLVSLLMQVELALMAELMSKAGWGMISENSLILVSTLSMYLIGGPICCLILKDMPTSYKPKKQYISAGKLMATFFICITIMYIGNLMGLTLMGVVSAALGKPFTNPVGETIEQLDTWTIFISMVIAAPIMEELLYRKILIDRIHQYGDLTAAIMSGILFGLSHGNFYQFFYAFGLGVIFAYIYINTGKLRYTIVFHAIINFLGSIVALYVGDNIWFAAAYGIFMLVAVILGIVFLIIYWKKIVWKPGCVVIPKEKQPRTLFLNFGVLAFFLVSCFLFVTSQMG